jgi:hypothetical protein
VHEAGGLRFALDPALARRTGPLRIDKTFDGYWVRPRVGRD